MTHPYEPGGDAAVVRLEEDGRTGVYSARVDTIEGSRVRTDDGLVFDLDAEGVGALADDRSTRLLPMDNELQADLLVHGEGYDPEEIERSLSQEITEPSLEPELGGEGRDI